MSRHEDGVTLRQMRDHIEEAVALAKPRTRAEFESDHVLFMPLLKLIEIVGSRKRPVHGYDAVDCDILRKIVTADFPALAGQIMPPAGGKP